MKQTTKTVPKVEPVDVLMGHIAASQLMLKDLQEALDEHLGKSPIDVNWGDVGDANHLREQIEGAVGTCMKIGFHPKHSYRFIRIEED